MSIISILVADLAELRRKHKKIELVVLQVVLGEIDKLKGSTGNDPSDDKVYSIIRKIIESNNETLSYIKDNKSDIEKLKKENLYLSQYLPKTLDSFEVINKLAIIVDKIREAKNDGAATGIAMQYLKKEGNKVLGKDVSAAVKKLRNL